MDIKEIAKRSQAMLFEWQLMRTELKEYAEKHPNESNAADPNYLHKALNYPGDLTPARIARVSNKIAHPK